MGHTVVNDDPQPPRLPHTGKTHNRLPYIALGAETALAREGGTLPSCTSESADVGPETPPVDCGADTNCFSLTSPANILRPPPPRIVDGATSPAISVFNDLRPKPAGPFFGRLRKSSVSLTGGASITIGAASWFRMASKSIVYGDSVGKSLETLLTSLPSDSGPAALHGTQRRW
jgi:hypothetical protein